MCSSDLVHGAGTALAGVAAHMGAGERKVLAQRVDQQGVGGDVYAGRAAVDGELHLHLAVSCDGDGWIRTAHLETPLPLLL